PGHPRAPRHPRAGSRGPMPVATGPPVVTPRPITLPDDRAGYIPMGHVAARQIWGNQIDEALTPMLIDDLKAFVEANVEGHLKGLWKSDGESQILFDTPNPNDGRFRI